MAAAQQTLKNSRPCLSAIHQLVRFLLATTKRTPPLPCLIALLLEAQRSSRSHPRHSAFSASPTETDTSLRNSFATSRMSSRRAVCGSHPTRAGRPLGVRVAPAPVTLARPLQPPLCPPPNVCNPICIVVGGGGHRSGPLTGPALPGTGPQRSALRRRKSGGSVCGRILTSEQLQGLDHCRDVFRSRICRDRMRRSGNIASLVERQL